MDPSVPDVAEIINFGIGVQNGTRYTWDPKTKPVPVDVEILVRKHYYAAVTYVDSLVGLLLSDLDRLGLADETVVIFHADHGYFMGFVPPSPSALLSRPPAALPPSPPNP